MNEFFEYLKHRPFWTGFCLGWAFGSLVLWRFFAVNRLIRSREEWQRAYQPESYDELRSDEINGDEWV